MSHTYKLLYKNTSTTVGDSISLILLVSRQISHLKRRSLNRVLTLTKDLLATGTEHRVTEGPDWTGPKKRKDFTQTGVETVTIGVSRDGRSRDRSIKNFIVESRGR